MDAGSYYKPKGALVEGSKLLQRKVLCVLAGFGWEIGGILGYFP